MKKYFLIVPAVSVSVLLIFLYFNFNKPPAPESGSGDVKFTETQICIQRCKETLPSKLNLDNGPCLLNPIPEHPDWVCDVAHSPRTPVDDNPENQCSAFREGRASHFIELSENCELIQKY